MGDKIVGGYLIQTFRLRTPNLSSENFTRYKEAKHDLEPPTQRTVHIRVNANISSSNFTHTATHAYSHSANMPFNLLKEQFTVEKSPQKKTHTTSLKYSPSANTTFDEGFNLTNTPKCTFSYTQNLC